MQLQDRLVLVTGSTRGIGRAIAKACVAAGARVIVHGRDPEAVAAVAREIEPERCFGLAADLDDPEKARQLVQAAGEHGDLYGLVNNAGGGRAVALRALKLEHWRATQRLNVESALLASQEAFHGMRKRRSGAIVNVASLAAHGGSGLMGADYGAAKAALVSLTRSFAQQSARFGIRCNAVSPGFVETDMTRDLSAEARSKLGIPQARLGDPREVADVVVFLLSDAASYMTGQVLHVDGGLFLGGA